MENKVAVLVIEQNVEDRARIVEALREQSYQLHLVSDVDAAMAFLRRKKAAAPFADLILLDTSIPEGLDLLGYIKSDAQLKLIPVIVLTEAAGPEGINLNYDRGANCCIHKPESEELFKAVVRDAVDFWAHLCHRVYREQDELVFVENRTRHP